MKEKNILALDLAKQVGYAIQRQSGFISSGSTSFAPLPGQMVDRLYVKWADWLDTTIDVNQIEYVNYELITFRIKNHHWQKMYNGMVAILRERCCRLNIPCHGVGVADIKQAATGQSKAKKVDMIATARAQWPDQNIIDDNQADALWLLYLACKKTGSNVQKHHAELF